MEEKSGRKIEEEQDLQGEPWAMIERRRGRQMHGGRERW